MSGVREAPYAVRFFQRSDGLVAVVYRRQANEKGQDRLARVSRISPLALRAATGFVRQAVAASANRNGRRTASFSPGPCFPLDHAWGPRLACYALVTAGLRDAERLMRAAAHLRSAHPEEAAWWLGLLLQRDNVRALRALRILTEAVA